MQDVDRRFLKLESLVLCSTAYIRLHLELSVFPLSFLFLFLVCWGGVRRGFGGRTDFLCSACMCVCIARVHVWVYIDV